MNVAYHLNGLGLKTHIISRIGNDTLGIELLDFLNTKEVPTTFIQIDNDFQTGVVDVILDEKGSPSYSIVHPVAWDNIEIKEELKTAVTAADALVYGSLACRDSVT